MRGVSKDLTHHVYHVELTQIIKHFGETSFLCMILNCLVKYLGFPILIFKNGCDEYCCKGRSTFLSFHALFCAASCLDPLPCLECLVCSANNLWIYLSIRTSAGWSIELPRIHFIFYSLQFEKPFSLTSFNLLYAHYNSIQVYKEDLPCRPVIKMIILISIFSGGTWSQRKLSGLPWLKTRFSWLNPEAFLLNHSHV